MASVHKTAEIINFICSDGKTIEVPKHLTARSTKLTEMLQELDENPGKFQNGVMRLPEISSDNFRRIICWCQFHQNDPQYRKGDRRHDEEMCSWDAEFVGIERHRLFEMMIATNSLGIDQLQELLAKAVANLIKGKTTEEIRQIYNITPDA